MKHLSVFQLLAITTLIVVTGVVFTAWRWYVLFDAFRGMSSEINVGAPAPAKRSLPLLKDLTPPSAIVSEIGNLVSTPFPFPPTKPELTSISKLQKLAEKLPGGGIDPKIEIDLLRRLSTGLASIPVFDSKTDDYDFERGSMNFRETREAARYWYFLGRLQAAGGRGRQALNSMLGVALLARLIDPLHPSEGALIARMISCACQGIAATGLIEIAPNLSLTHAELSAAIKQLERLEEGMPIVDVFDAERRNMIEMSRFVLKKAAAGNAAFKRQEPLARLFADERPLEPYFKQLFLPMMDAARLPFKDAYAKMKAHSEVLEKFQAGITNPNRIIGYLLTPQRLFIEMVFAVSIPNLAQAFANDFKSRQGLRGAAIALGVHAYHTQLGRWPTSLAEVETWLGHSFQNDLFSGEPVRFKVGEPPRIFSVGRDLAPDTDDDMVFVPLAGLETRAESGN